MICNLFALGLTILPQHLVSSHLSYTIVMPACTLFLCHCPPWFSGGEKFYGSSLCKTSYEILTSENVMSLPGVECDTFWESS